MFASVKKNLSLEVISFLDDLHNQHCQLGRQVKEPGTQHLLLSGIMRHSTALSHWRICCTSQDVCPFLALPEPRRIFLIFFYSASRKSLWLLSTWAAVSFIHLCLTQINDPHVWLARIWQISTRNPSSPTPCSHCISVMAAGDYPAVLAYVWLHQVCVWSSSLVSLFSVLLTVYSRFMTSGVGMDHILFWVTSEMKRLWEHSFPEFWVSA